MTEGGLDLGAIFDLVAADAVRKQLACGRPAGATGSELAEAAILAALLLLRTEDAPRWGIVSSTWDGLSVIVAGHFGRVVIFAPVGAFAVCAGPVSACLEACRQLQASGVLGAQARLRAAT